MKRARFDSDDRLMVICAFVLGAAFIGVAILVLRHAVTEARTVAALRDHGAIAEGRWVRTTSEVYDHRKTTSPHPRAGPDVSVIRNRIYAYRVGRRALEMRDRGESVTDSTFDPEAPESRLPTPGMPVFADVVYLPEAPEVARLRRELDPKTEENWIVGGVFLACGLVLVGFGLWYLLKRRKSPAP
jgi:hypothetical protein